MHINCWFKRWYLEVHNKVESVCLKLEMTLESLVDCQKHLLIKALLGRKPIFLFAPLSARCVNNFQAQSSFNKFFQVGERFGKFIFSIFSFQIEIFSRKVWVWKKVPKKNTFQDDFSQIFVQSKNLIFQSRRQVSRRFWITRKK